MLVSELHLSSYSTIYDLSSLSRGGGDFGSSFKKLRYQENSSRTCDSEDLLLQGAQIKLDSLAGEVH